MTTLASGEAALPPRATSGPGPEGTPVRGRPGLPGRVVAAARAYPVLCATGAAVFAAVALALLVSVAVQSSQAWSHSGVGFLWSGVWDPATNRYGAGLLVVGTLVTTGVAMLLAVPFGLGVAVFLTEVAPRKLGAAAGAVIEFLAAVPSIVVGLWALLVLSPVFARHVEPFLAKVPGLDSIFGGPAYGPGILLASVVLAIMTLPTVVALSRNAISGVAAADREAALALGATRWQMVRRAVLPGARRGIAAAVTLAVGRAMGESIAVALVIGNRPSLPHSLLAPGATIGSAIVNQFAEAQPGLATASIIGLAAVLLLLTMAVNAVGATLLERSGGGTDHPVPGPPATAATPATGDPAAHPTVAPGAAGHHPAGPSVAAVAAASLGRRRRTSAAMSVLCGLCTAAAAVPLVAVIWYTAARGVHLISLSFLTNSPTPSGIPGGGISTAITGSARIVGLALVMAVPTGLLCALFLYERGGRIASALRFLADVMTGVPSIVIGIFAYAALVEPLHHASTTAASFALAVLMVPIMIRGNEEALKAVPVDLWEAGIALGAHRSSVARRVMIRESMASLVSANLLATARSVGETAPLLFTVAAPSAALTLWIYDQGTQPYQSAQQTAWATALVLLIAVFLLSSLARLAAWRLTRHQR